MFGHETRSLSNHFNRIYLFLAAVAILIGIIGMLQVATTFAFFSDELHLFADSLWAVDHSFSFYTPNIESLYNTYLTVHYPERGGHPNGMALMMGVLMWILSQIKEVNLVNLSFFVWSIRLLLIIAFILSLLFLHLFMKEVDETRGKWIGQTTVIISAIFPPLIAYGSIRALDTMSLLFMMISLWSFLRLLKSPHPSIITWLLPGISAGIFLTLKISGPLIVLVLISYSIILGGKWGWKEVGKKMMLTCLLSLLVLFATNNPYLYAEVLFFPSSPEFHSLTDSDDIRKFGFIGFQIAKLWEFFHPDYYHYLGFHRHGGSNLPFLGLVNKYVTLSFLLLHIASLGVLLIFRKWKELLLFNIPFILLFLSLPNLQIYRFLPVFPLWLATIAFALVIIWHNYTTALHRIVIALMIVIIFFISPSYAVIKKPVVDKETYLDLGDVAARNRHLHFKREIFYDRRLRTFRAYQAGTPFCLIPKRNGILKEDIVFKKPGEYFIDILLGTMVRNDNAILTLGINLGGKEYTISSKDKENRWFRTGPFLIKPDAGEKELSIDIQGIRQEKDGNNAIAIYDIRIIKSDASAEALGQMPIPWWMERQPN